MQFWGGKTKKLLSPSIKNRGPLLQAAKKPTPLLGRKHSRHNPWRECCNELVFVFRRTRIVPVGIRRLNPAVLPVDHHFRTLISADDSARLNGLVLRFKVATCTRASSAFYVPTAVCRRNNVVCLSCHFSVSFQLKIWIIERGETTDPPICVKRSSYERFRGTQNAKARLPRSYAQRRRPSRRVMNGRKMRMYSVVSFFKLRLLLSLRFQMNRANDLRCHV